MHGGVCRCDALAVFGETADNSQAQSKACGFLVSKQRSDGGWAESYLSSQTKVSAALPSGLVPGHSSDCMHQPEEEQGSF